MITPISWILLHQPQNDDADASIPIVTRTDDTYVTPTTKPVSNPPTPKPTPTPTPSATPTPTDSATPTSTPSTTDPTGRPTSSPTEGRTTTAPTTRPTPGDRTTTSTQPSTSNPPPPVDDGNMSSDELQLFRMIDNARVNAGCAPLKRDSDLSGSAGSEAADRAESGSVNSYNSSKSTAGGDDWTAQQAFDKMMSQSKSTILNCGLTTLGVGKDDAVYDSGLLCPFVACSDRTRVAWVADFR